MGHTNSTANLSLPQFIGTDKPTWLGDVNGAFSAIDAYVGTNDAAVSAAVSDASSAISQASAAVNTANTANTTAGNASTAANNAIGVANTANAIAGTVDAKVGLLADLNTTDRTSIVNAINEVNAGLPISGEVSVTGDGVKTYGTLLNELYALVDHSKVSPKTVLYLGASIFRITLIGANQFRFNTAIMQGSPLNVLSEQIILKTASEFDAKAEGSTTSDYSSLTATNGEIIKVVY